MTGPIHPTGLSWRELLGRGPVLVAIGGNVAGLALMGFSPAAGLGVCVASVLVLLYALLVPNAQGFGEVCTRFETAEREVWLTIDDGPDPEDTPRVLEALGRHGAKAGFFLVGERAARYPELVAAIRRAGHGVHHHTHSHPLASFWCASVGRVTRELDAAAQVLGEGREGSLEFFRAPAGVKNFFLHPLLRQRGLRCVGWSTRGREIVSRSVEEVTQRIARGARPGAILLLHEGSGVPAALRVNVIESVLETLTRDGYRCVRPPGSALR